MNHGALCYRSSMLCKVLSFLLAILLVQAAQAKDKYLKPQSVKLDSSGEKWAEKTLKKLSLEEKVGQLFMVRVQAEFLNANSPQYLTLRDTIRKYHVGSLILTVRAEGPFLYK